MCWINFPFRLMCRRLTVLALFREHEFFAEKKKEPKTLKV
jgi:hypothetical protein